MKKRLLKRAIFFMISCNIVIFTPTWASQETKNTITSSSIEVSDGSIKNIVNDDINIIDTNVRDEYGIFSNNGGKLNIDVDSLTIEHNIDRSNMFTSILSQGNTLQGLASPVKRFTKSRQLRFPARRAALTAGGAAFRTSEKGSSHMIQLPGFRARGEFEKSFIRTNGP